MSYEHLKSNWGDPIFIKQSYSSKYIKKMVGLKSKNGKVVNKTYLIFYFFFTASILLCESVYAQKNIEVHPLKDVMLISATPNTNYGTSTVLGIQNTSINGNAVSLLYFDLSSIPQNAIIESAYLDLYCTSNTDGVVLRIGRVDPTTSWIETGVTWNNMPSVKASPSQEKTITTTKYSGSDVKEFVQDWVSGKYSNNGFQLSTETSEGSASFYSREDGINYTPKLLINYSVPTPKGNLQVTVQNCDGCSTSLPGADAVVQLYNQNDNPVGSPQPTNSNGVATFSNIAAGTGYYYKVYHNPNTPSTIFGQEYWGRRDANIGIVDGETNTDTFKRNMPYTGVDVHIYNDDTGQEIKNGDSVDLGTKLRIVIPVVNPNNNGSRDQNVEERLVIDKDKIATASGYDFNQTSNGQSMSKGSTSNYTFYFTPPQTGSYYYVLGSLTDVDGEYKYTDGWAWDNSVYFTVSAKSPVLITNFQVPEGQVNRDEIKKITVNVKNMSNTKRQFWVGLSFGHESTTLDKWPVGWYDIMPKQTAMLNPGQEDQVTFSVIISKTLRSGQYYALARIWNSFDKELYVMKGYLDGTLNYPKWVDKQVLGKKSFYLPYAKLTYEDFPLPAQFKYIVDLVKSRTLNDLYVSGKKPLLFFKATIPFEINGIKIAAGEGIFFDIDDICGITPEGKEGKTTFWITTELSALKAKTLNSNTKTSGSSNFDMGIVLKDFDPNEQGIADYEVLKTENNWLNFKLFGIGFTGMSFNWDNKFSFGNVEISGTKEINFNLSLENDQLIDAQGEISTQNLINILKTKSSAQILSIDNYINNISNDFNSMSPILYDFTPDDGDILITNGEIINNLKMHVFIDDILNKGKNWSNSFNRFVINVPENAKNLNVLTTDGTGDVSLFYRYNARPYYGNHDTHKYYDPGTTQEHFLIENPKPGKYYIAIGTGSTQDHYKYSGVRFIASYDSTYSSNSILNVTPTDINFGTNAATNAPFDTTFTVQNIGDGTLTVNISKNASWITSINPVSFSLSSGNKKQITIQGKLPGPVGSSFRDSIVVSSTNGDRKAIIIHGSTVITSIKKLSSSIPKKYGLYQNYPNPFNPTTVIHYDLPSAQHVVLKVYNTLGQQAATLVNKTQAAGSYSVSFDAHNLPSGMYIYRLKAGKYVKTEKMMLIK